jgi:uncharacterized membrane protein YphA (DoxX/SURF4 family)
MIDGDTGRTRRSAPVDGWWPVGIVARLLVGGTFLFSGATKVIDVDATVRSVRAYQLLPEAVVPLVGTSLPIVELALAVLMLTGLLIRAAAVATVPLCAAFLIGVASAWVRGLSIECGCFGNGGYTADPVPGYVRELLINVVLIAASIWLARRPDTGWSVDRLLGLRSEPVAADTSDSGGQR